MLKYIPFFFFLLSFHNQTLHATPKVAIIGDSLATGAGTHPNLKFDHQNFWEILNGNHSLKAPQNKSLEEFSIYSSPSSPKTLWRSSREYDNITQWFTYELIYGFTKLYFDTPAYSWGNLVAHKLGYGSDEVVITAEDGAKVESFTRQVDRLLDHTGGQLPDKIFVFFTNYDLCAAHTHLLTSKSDFEDHLTQGIKYIIRNGKAASQGTQIYFPHYLGLSQLLIKDSILNHEFEAHKEPTTCKELRDRDFQPSSYEVFSQLPPESLYLRNFAPPNPAVQCRTLFSQKFLAQSQIGFFSQFDPKKRKKEIQEAVTEMISNIAGRIRSYRDATDEAIKKSQSWLKKEKKDTRFSLRQLNSTAHINFEGEDVAPDCFHLSLKGQMKIARSILTDLEGPKLLPAPTK